MRNMTTYKISFPIFIIVSLIGTGLMFGQSSQQATAPKQAVSGPADTKKSTSADTAVNQIVDKIVAREAALAAVMKDMHPLVETYLQTLEKDDELAFHPTGDQYFLGKLDFNPGQIRERTFMNQANKSANIASSIAAGFKQMYSVRYLPEGFEQMLVVSGGFDRNTYNFEYVRREFLGAVRCLVFDVTAKKGGSGTFQRTHLG